MEPDKSPVQTIHLSDYWNVITKRKTLVITFACMTIAVTLLVSFLMKPVYQTTARLSIERESNSSPITGQRTEYIDVQSQLLTFNTHFKLIKSKPVIESLLQEINALDGAEENMADALATSPLQAITGYIRDNVTRLKENVRLILKKEETVLSEQELLDQQIEQLQKQVEISHQRETRLLNIVVEDTDRELAAQIANLLAQKYIEFDLATRLASENQNLEWLTKEVYSLKKRLEDDERAFYEYKQLNKVFSIEGKQKVIDQKISELNNEFLATRSRRQDIEAKLTEINKQYDGSADIAYVRSVLDNKSIDEVYTNLTTLELEHSRLAKVFKHKHPKIQQITEEILKVKAKFKAELNKEIENLKVQRNILINREAVMEQNIAEFEDDAMNTNSKELKYTILQRNMETSQKLYDTLVSKIKEVGVVSGGASSNIRIVENASVPINPAKPNKKKNLLLSLLLGVFGGVGLAFFLEYLDQTVRTEDDIEKLVGLPVLSVIPIADKADKQGYY